LQKRDDEYETQHLVGTDEASGVVRDKRIYPIDLKGKFYKTMVKPVTLYGSEMLDSRQENRTEYEYVKVIEWND